MTATWNEQSPVPASATSWLKREVKSGVGRHTKQEEKRPTGDTSAVCKVWWHLCRWSSVEASGREEWKRSGGRAGSLGERCLPSPGVLSLRKEFVVDSLAQQWACVVIGGSLQEMELGSTFLLQSKETDAGGSVGNQMIAEKSLVPTVNFLLCSQSGGTPARGLRWKHPGGRSGKGVAEGLASFVERCLPSPGVLSPYK